MTDRVSALDLDDIYQGALDATRYEGKYYGMPWLNDVKYMFVNMEILKQAGIEEAPATWDQLIEDAKLCKEKGFCEYPIVACYAQAECLICDYTCIAGSFGLLCQLHKLAGKLLGRGCSGRDGISELHQTSGDRG